MKKSHKVNLLITNKWLRSPNREDLKAKLSAKEERELRDIRSSYPIYINLKFSFKE